LKYQPTFSLESTMETFHRETKRELKKDSKQGFVEGDNDSVEGIMFDKNRYIKICLYFFEFILSAPFIQWQKFNNCSYYIWHSQYQFKKIEITQ